MPTPSESGEWKYAEAEKGALRRANELLIHDPGYQEIAKVLANRDLLGALKGVWDSWEMTEKVNVLGLFEHDRPKVFRPEIKFPVVTKEEISHLDFYHYTGLELQNVVARALERGGGIDILGRPVYGYPEVENLGYRVGGGLPTNLEFRFHDRQIGNVSASVNVSYTDNRIVIGFMGMTFSTVGELTDYIGDKLQKGEGADLYSVPVDMQWMAQMDKRDREEERERKRRERQGRDDDDFHWD